MSKLSEYLKLVPAGFKNLDKVVDGIKNQIKMELGALPEEDIEIITQRRLICSTCPFLSVNAEKAMLYKSDRTDVHCTMCGCPIQTKTSSLVSNCGIEVYNHNNPQTPMPLKWVQKQ